MLKRLSHPSILPLLGITLEPLQLILSWMPGGNLMEYVKKHPGSDRIRLVGTLLQHPSYADPHYQLSDVAGGLRYLHSCNVIHGDLKGVCNHSQLVLPSSLPLIDQENVLVDGFGRARIADFGLAMVTKNIDSIPSASQNLSPRWTAPEVLREGKYSKEADVFSFAMVMYEVHCR